MDMTEQKQIADFVTANPEDSLSEIVEIFAEKQNSAEMHIFRIKMIKKILGAGFWNKSNRGSRKIQNIFPITPWANNWMLEDERFHENSD